MQLLQSLSNTHTHTHRVDTHQRNYTLAKKRERKHWKIEGDAGPPPPPLHCVHSNDYGDEKLAQKRRKAHRSTAIAFLFILSVATPQQQQQQDNNAILSHTQQGEKKKKRQKQMSEQRQHLLPKGKVEQK